MSGKHMAKTNKNAKNRKKPLSLLVLLLVLAGMVVGGTVAYLLTATDAITNTFTPANTTPEIVEEIKDHAKTSIVIQNDGTASAYIRVALVGNTVDADGKVTGGFEVNVTGLGANWVKASDGYYYYTQPVAGGSATGNLLGDGATILVEDGHTVTVLAQSIQAEPSTVVTDVWSSGVSGVNGTTLTIRTA